MRMKFTAVQITKNLNLLHFIRSMRKKVWKFSQLIRMTTWNSKYERANCVLAPVDNSILYMTHTVKPRNWQMHAPGYMPVKSSPRSHSGNPYIQLCFFQSITFFNRICTNTGNGGGRKSNLLIEVHCTDTRLLNVFLKFAILISFICVSIFRIGVIKQDDTQFDSHWESRNYFKCGIRKITDDYV